MTQKFLEQLQAWQDELAELAIDCGCAKREQEAVLLRAAHALLEQAPLGWRGHFAGGPSLATIDLLTAAGGANAAALALVEGRCCYMLSHGPQGRHIATVAVEGLAEEASSGGESAALALVGALASCLAGQVHDIDGGYVAGMFSPSLRLN